MMIGLAFIGVAGALYAKEVVKNKPIEKSYKHDEYNRLFDSMGLLKLDNGEWVEYKGTEDKECYKLSTFKVCDSVDIGDFAKRTDDIKSKCDLPHLEIYTEDRLMKFKMRKIDVPIKSFERIQCDNRLIPLGVNDDNELVYWDIVSDPHALVAGVTSCGKSTLVSEMIMHIIMAHGELYLIDLKAGLEFGKFEKCQGVRQYAEEMKDAPTVISAFYHETMRRYKILKEKGYRNYNDYIKETGDAMPRAYLIIDEFADLTAKKRGKDNTVLDELIEMARKCRAVGMHIILATQRVSVDVVPGTLKCNFSCVIGFRAVNKSNSQIIIDEPGLEELQDRTCIGILKGRKTFFRTMYLDDKRLKKTIDMYQREESEIPIEPQQQETPPIDDDFFNEDFLNDLE